MNYLKLFENPDNISWYDDKFYYRSGGYIEDTRKVNWVYLYDKNLDPTRIFPDFFFCRAERTRSSQHLRRDRCFLVEKCNVCHHSLNNHKHVRQEVKMVQESELTKIIADLKQKLSVANRELTFSVNDDSTAIIRHTISGINKTLAGKPSEGIRGLNKLVSDYQTRLQNAEKQKEKDRQNTLKMNDMVAY